MKNIQKILGELDCWINTLTFDHQQATLTFLADSSLSEELRAHLCRFIIVQLPPALGFAHKMNAERLGRIPPLREMDITFLPCPPGWGENIYGKTTGDLENSEHSEKYLG